MKKIKTTNRYASDYVRNQKPFTNSNNQLYGEWVTPDTYAVFSYGPHWPLYIWRNGVWFENEDRYSVNGDRYSVTTSRHRTYAHPRGEYQTQKRSVQWMLDAIENAHMDYNHAIQMHDKINEALGVA